MANSRERFDICKHLFGVLAEEKLTNTAAEGGLISIWGEVLYELNELDEALRYEKKGLLLLELGTPCWCPAVGPICVC